MTTKDDAVALGHQGAVDIAAMLDWFDANDPANAAEWQAIRHRLHTVAARAEELAGVPYGTFLAGGTDKPPH